MDLEKSEVKRLNQYIARAVMSSTALVLFVLLGLEMFIELVKELGDVGTGNYGVLQALVYVLLFIPQDAYQLFPMAALLGGLIGLGRLATTSELIVMRAAGVSKSQITWSVIKVALLMILVITLIGEYVAPAAVKFANQQKAAAVSSGQALHTTHGTWIRDGNNFIHIDMVSANKIVNNITRYQFNDKHQLILASFAKQGVYTQNQWVFTDIDQSQIYFDHVVSKHIAQQIWNISFNPRLLSFGQVEPDQESTQKLYRLIKYRKQSGLQSNEFQYAFWKRVLQPLTTLVMVCLAVSFIFGPLRSVTLGLRVVSGVILGFGFYTLNEFFGPFSMVYQFPPFTAALLPTLLFAVIGGVLLWRGR